MTRAVPAPLAHNRYLTGPSGGAILSRTRALFVLLGGLLLAPAALLIGGLAAHAATGIDWLESVFAALALVTFLVSIAAIWALIFAASRRLREAAPGAVHGDFERVRAAAHFVLRWVFRSDFQTRALYMLGLCAEARGDLLEASDLFRRALLMLPVGAAPQRRAAASALLRGHQILALTGLGALDPAAALLRQLHADLQRSTTQGALDALLDDGDWGLGAVSVNSTLAQLEPGRPPRALAALAGALLAVRRGHAREALDVLAREQASLSGGTLPRERELLAAIDRSARVALSSGGPMRALDVPAGDSPWTRAMLGELSR